VAGYEIQITEAAAKEIDALPRAKDRQAVVKRIVSLGETPRPSGCVKLSGVENLYRVRQGPYRIVYTIEEDCLVVIVIRVADRKDVYHSRGGGARSVQRTRPFGPGR
jgi:mRNA interferase RelE/StbE